MIIHTNIVILKQYPAILRLFDIGAIQQVKRKNPAIKLDFFVREMRLELTQVLPH